MKEIKRAIVLVDTYRRPSRKRNTAGRYIVSAKSEKEAVELVQKAIGFGSVQFYYWEQNDSYKFINYKEVKKSDITLSEKIEKKAEIKRDMLRLVEQMRKIGSLIGMDINNRLKAANKIVTQQDEEINDEFGDI